MAIQSVVLNTIPGVQHGFGNRTDPVPKAFLKTWVELRPTWQQVHGIAIAEVQKKNQICGDADVLFTRTKNPIAVVTADCVPILFAKKDGSLVAAMHAGWRGTQAKIIERFADTLRAQGHSLSEFVACLGPCIQKCCYTVGEDLIQSFRKTFPGIEPDIISPAEKKLDLKAVNTAELHRLGFSQIEALDYFTYCHITDRGPIFHSYRREGGGTRQWSLISRL